MKKNLVQDIIKKDLLLTSGFTQAGVYARRQFCADIQVCSPQELLWNPRLREAATTLGASRRHRGGQKAKSKNVRSENLTKYEVNY